MNALYNQIIGFLESKNVINKEDRAVYLYGLDLAAYTFLSTAGLIVIGVLFQRTLEAVVIIGLFYTNQSAGGGYHASSHMGCFLSMSVALAVCLCTFFFPANMAVYMVLALLSLGVLFCCPLVLHRNKQYLQSKSSFFIARSRLIVAAQAGLLVIAALWLNPVIFQAIALGVMVSGISRLVGRYEAIKGQKQSIR